MPLKKLGHGRKMKKNKKKYTKYKIILEVEKEYFGEKHRSTLDVIFWEGATAAKLEFRQQYFSGKYDDWVNSKLSGLKPHNVEWIFNNQDAIREALNTQVSPEELI